MFAILFVAGDLRHERALTKLDAVQLGAKASRAPCRRHDPRRSTSTPITKWEQVSGVIAKHKAGDEIQIVVSRDGQRIAKNVDAHRAGGRRPDARCSPASRATVVVPHPGFFKSIAMAPARRRSSIAHDAVDALGQIFSPSGISKYMHVLTGADKSEAANQQRFLSPVGFAQVASHAVDGGLGRGRRPAARRSTCSSGSSTSCRCCRSTAGTSRSRPTSRSRRRSTPPESPVDAAKLMPIAGAVLVVLMFILVSSLFLDITHPVANPF